MRKIVLTISGHQGKVDFKVLKEAGVYGVMLKCTEGQGYISPVFHENYKAARAAGLKVGAFHDLIATSTVPACKEGRWFGENIEGLKFNLPLAVVIDPELANLKDRPERGQATPADGYNIINAFAQNVAKYDRETVYKNHTMAIATTATYFKKYFCDSDLQEYRRWLIKGDEKPQFEKKVRMAQCSVLEHEALEHPAPMSVYYNPAERHNVRYQPTL